MAEMLQLRIGRAMEEMRGYATLFVLLALVRLIRVQVSAAERRFSVIPCARRKAGQIIKRNTVVVRRKPRALTRD